MLAALVLNLFVLLSHQTPAAGQPDHSATRAASATIDPYAPLRLYDGKWDLVPAAAGKPADPVHIENHCAKAGDFFVCNQFVNGKSMALVVFLPQHALDNGGYSYRNQALQPEADGPGSWGNLEITGDRWIYSSEGTDKGKKTFFRTANLFTGTDKIHFEVQHSDDGTNWITQMSGDESRVK